jgi:hypothetical protein
VSANHPGIRTPASSVNPDLIALAQRWAALGIGKARLIISVDITGDDDSPIRYSFTVAMPNGRGAHGETGKGTLTLDAAIAAVEEQIAIGGLPR